MVWDKKRHHTEVVAKLLEESIYECEMQGDKSQHFNIQSIMRLFLFTSSTKCQ